jgi:predicted DnaQ family exonuclease/DinG family helicase
MPRLFDLLPENTKKDLANEARKASKNNQLPKNVHQPKPEMAPIQKISVPIPDFVAFDVETTGLDFKSDRVIEIGAVKFVNGQPSEQFSTLINPGVQVPDYITDLTGIKNDDLVSAPDFGTISESFVAFIGTLPLCGHQIEFDQTFLNEELKRLGKEAIFSNLIDTALLSRILIQPLERYSLKYVSGHLGVGLDNAHRALHDAKASGEVAVKLIPKIADLPLNVRQTIAACAPGSMLKSLFIKSLGNVRYAVTLNTDRHFPTLTKLGLPESFVEINRKSIDELFSENGKLSKTIDAFCVRNAQRDMALQVTDALNTQSILVAEAGTGTGKSLAYLLPAATWAFANSCRVIVSTRTKNLQDQLIQKDIPMVVKATGMNLKYSVLKGRANYICLSRWKKLLYGEAGNMSPRERFAVLTLIPWVESTKTGDIEDQNQFNQKWFGKVWNLISAESHECSGRRCPHFQSCFLQNARQNALGAHIVIINHALFFSEICSENSFLGKIGSIVFDEAHHLESSGHRFLRVEFDTHRTSLFIETINNLYQKIAAVENEKKFDENGKSLRNILKNMRKRTQEALGVVAQWAKKTNPEALSDYQITYTESAFEYANELHSYQAIITELIDLLRDIKQDITAHPRAEDFDDIGAEIQTCSERASQLKADIQYLIAAKTEDHVFWVEGNHDKGWTKLCGVPLDIGGLLSEIWERCSGAVVFTSATLSISQNIDYFKRGAGITPHESRTCTGIYKSPFDSNQAIYGGIKNAPDPDKPEFPGYVADALKKLHTEFEKNILVLFTANSMLNAVNDILKNDPAIDRNKLLAQGVSGTRNAILEQFKQNSRMILLGTDSFWEGIDVPGEACEIVVIPRLPFPVPSHPLTQALSKRMEAQNGESFFSYSIPEAVIKFRQGVGRLIRTSTDRGALVVLDHRILSKGYGKQFIRSIECDFKNFGDTDTMISDIRQFFESGPADGFKETVTYVPLEDA